MQQIFCGMNRLDTHTHSLTASRYTTSIVLLKQNVTAAAADVNKVALPWFSLAGYLCSLSLSAYLPLTCLSREFQHTIFTQREINKLALMSRIKVCGALLEQKFIMRRSD